MTVHWKYLLCFTICILQSAICNPAWSAEPKYAGADARAEAGSGRGHWRIYDASDDFPLAIVAGMVQDKDGYLWFGGGGGVTRFDGINWQMFTPEDGWANDWVWPMLIDRDGNLWCGTGNVQCIGEAGVSRYDGASWKTFTTRDGLVNDCVISLCEDRDGNLWFGTSGGLSRYDGARWQTFTTKDGLASNYVVYIFQDRDGVMWFAGGNPISGESGLTRYDPGQGTWQTITTEDGLGSEKVMLVHQDQKGDFWFGTYGGGHHPIFAKCKRKVANLYDKRRPGKRSSGRIDFRGQNRWYLGYVCAWRESL